MNIAIEFMKSTPISNSSKWIELCRKFKVNIMTLQKFVNFTGWALGFMGLVLLLYHTPLLQIASKFGDDVAKDLEVRFFKP